MSRILRTALSVLLATMLVAAPAAAARPIRECVVPLRWGDASVLVVTWATGGAAYDAGEPSVTLTPGRYHFSWDTGRVEALRLNAGCRARWTVLAQP